MSANPLRKIPSIHELLENPTLKTLAERLHPGAVVSTVRVVLDEVAAEVHNAATEKALPSVAELAERISRRVLEGQRFEPSKAINATGILLHPELGSPPWPEAAVEAMTAAASGYTTGRPTSSAHIVAAAEPAQQRLKELTGAEGVLIFNSTAAATIATLAAVVGRQEAVIARGQVIRRDPDYHLPELAEAARVALREVGAANDTQLDDYRRAIGEHSGAILIVDRSSVAAPGSDEDVGLKELVHLGREHRLPLIHDLGPAGLVDLGSLGIDFAPLVSKSVDTGVDLVVFGHELLGGPACGIVAGRRNLIESIGRHVTARSSQVPRPVLAALAATVDLLHSADQARRHVPLLRLLTTSADNLKNRAERLAPQMAATGVVQSAEVVAASGSLMGPHRRRGAVAGWGVALRPKGTSVAQLAEALRRGQPAVIGQEDDRLLVNLRSVSAEEDMQLVEVIEGLDRSL